MLAARFDGGIGVLLTSICASIWASGADVSGKWSGSSPDGKPIGKVYAILRQDGATLSIITIFAVVIVLNDERTHAGGPVEKLKATSDWVSHTDRELMRRSHVRNPDRPFAFRWLRKLDSMIVNRRWDQFSPRSQESASSARVMRLLY